jgi:hypothetical protein
MRLLRLRQATIWMIRPISLNKVHSFWMTPSRIRPRVISLEGAFPVAGIDRMSRLVTDAEPQAWAVQGFAGGRVELLIEHP